jgi:hypothetical protein
MERNDIEYVGYAETRRVLDNFLNKSGIRRICREECKGGCCFNCTDNKPKTVEEQKNCSQNLSCMAFVCYDFRSCFEHAHIIEHKEADVLEIIEDLHRRSLREGNRSQYFAPDSILIKKRGPSAFRIKRDYINALKDEKRMNIIKTFLEEDERIKQFVERKRERNRVKEAFAQ